MNSLKPQQHIELFLLSIKDKTILAFFSVLGFVGVLFWMFYSADASTVLDFLIQGVGLLFFLVAFWSATQYNNVKLISNLLGIITCVVSFTLMNTYDTMSYLLLFTLFSPVIVIALMHGLQSLVWASVLTVAITVHAFLVPFIKNPVILSMFLAILWFQFITSLVFLFYVNSYKNRLIESQQNLRKSVDEYRKKEAFIGGLSHQIRTPLSTILGVADMLKSSKLNEVQTDMMDAIVTSSNNLLTLSDQILSNANLSTDDTPSEEDATFNIRKVLDNLMIDIQAEGVVDKLKINYSQYLPEVLNGKPDVISSIVTKTLQALKDNSTSHLNADVFIYDKKETVSSLEVLVEIHTTGLNVAVSNGNPLFSNGDSLHDEAVLQALGLEEMSDYTASKGGDFSIRFSDTNNLIVSFTALFWKDNADKLVMDRIQKAVQSVEEPHISYLENATILVVEDNLMNQKVVGMALKNKVKKIDYANNGKEAVRMFSNTKYDLILMDLMMPIMDGHKATEKIRELESGTDLHTPIIALTANARAGVKETCVASGMNDYLTKPFKFETLLSKIETYLSEKVN